MDADPSSPRHNNGAKQGIPLTDLHSVERTHPSEDAPQTTEIGPEIVVLEPDLRRNDQEILKDKNSFLIDKVFHRIREAVLEHKKLIKQIVCSLLLLLYLVYVVYSLSFRFGDEGAWILLICTILLVMYLGWGIVKTLSVYQSFKKSIGSKNPENITKAKKIIRRALYLVVLALIAVYIGLTVVQTRPRNLISLGGIFVFIFILFLMSNNKANIKWHTVFWGLSLQFGFALAILRTEWGISTIHWVTDSFMEFIAFFDKGSAFIFSEKYKDFKVIFKVVPSVIVFCAVIGGLSYLGVLAFIVSNFGGFLGYCLQTNPVESINAATNIFLSGVCIYIVQLKCELAQRLPDVCIL